MFWRKRNEMTINLETLKVGDKVRLRDLDEAYEVTYIKYEDDIRKYIVKFRYLEHFIYFPDGKQLANTTSSSDIVKIIPKQSEFQLQNELLAIDIPVHRFECDLYKRIVKDCFGLHYHEMPTYSKRYTPYGEKMTLICRPEQFAAFIVRRNQSGVQNMVKELDPRYVRVYTKNTMVAYVAENP